MKLNMNHTIRYCTSTILFVQTWAWYVLMYANKLNDISLIIEFCSCIWWIFFWVQNRHLQEPFDLRPILTISSHANFTDSSSHLNESDTKDNWFSSIIRMNPCCYHVITFEVLYVVLSQIAVLIWEFFVVTCTHPTA